MLPMAPGAQLIPMRAFLEEDGDLDRAWCQPYSARLYQHPVQLPPGSFRPGLPPWLPALLNDMKNEPQLQPSILVHEWEFGKVAEDTGVVCIPALSYPVLSEDIKNSYMPYPSLETTTASFSSPNSLDLSQPFVHS